MDARTPLALEPSPGMPPWLALKSMDEQARNHSEASRIRAPFSSFAVPSPSLAVSVCLSPPATSSQKERQSGR